MAMAAAIFDLDRTLIASSSAPIFAQHIADAGIAETPSIPLADLFLKYYEHFGESRLTMAPARHAVRSSAGWPVDGVREAAAAASKEIVKLLQPFAQSVFDEHRAAGRTLVLATTSPDAFVVPLAAELGFDAVVCSRWKQKDGLYTGELDGPFVWGREKADAVRTWAAENDVRLDRSYAYSDSYYDSPLLDAVGHPVAVNPDAQLAATAVVQGWPIRHLDKTEGIIKIAGREVQEWARPLMQRPELVAPYADLSFEGLDNIPAEGAAILVFNHRSYFDPTVMGMLVAKAGRSVRGLGKKEVFDVPIVGKLLAGIGGVRVDRASGSDEPLKKAAEALAGGEIVMLAPQGTIPRGPAFFDPELKGRFGAARLAEMSRVPVIPIGLWGTEVVWPRSARLPNIAPLQRPVVSVAVGPPVKLNYRSTEADTKAIMTAIAALLPPESRKKRTPTEAELALTFPPGYSGTPDAELDRRPGTDT